MAHNNGKVTMAVLGTKLDALTDVIAELAGEFKTHVKEDRQVALDVHDLKQAHENRKRHLWVIYPAIVASFLGWVKSLF